MVIVDDGTGVDAPKAISFLNDVPSVPNEAYDLS